MARRVTRRRPTSGWFGGYLQRVLQTIFLLSGSSVQGWVDRVPGWVLLWDEWGRVGGGGNICFSSI